MIKIHYLYPMSRPSRKSEEQPLKLAIEAFLKTYHLEDKLSETKLLHSWDKVVGSMVARHTQRIYIRNKKLFVKLDSDALRNELFYMKEKIILSLNKDAGRFVIEEIVLQ